MVWVDMPLLFETGAYKWMSCNAVVRLDTETQVCGMGSRFKGLQESWIAGVLNSGGLDLKLFFTFFIFS
jgi:dephospho-CoA kinase